MSRFRFESNSAIPHPEPIGEREQSRDSDHEELPAMHARHKHGSKKKGERREKDSAGEPESIRARMFFAQNRQGGGD